MFEGKALSLLKLEKDIVELCFDRRDTTVNMLDTICLTELRQAIDRLHQLKNVTGLIITSAKDSFIVGADIREFGQYFAKPKEELVRWLQEANEIFCAIEEFSFPTSAAINGAALGGGFELTLAADFRIMSTQAVVGLPETRLGIIPGFGGTVRLPRIIGADNAIEWISKALRATPELAFKARAVDAVVAPEKLRESTMATLVLAATGKLDWRAGKERKKTPLQLNPIESIMVFETAKSLIASKTGTHYPAPLAAVDAIWQGAGKDRDGALLIESGVFASVAKTSEADALTQLFLNDQSLKRKTRVATKDIPPVKRAGVLGAGIMGGGIAYQCAAKGTSVLLKDISEEQLQLGLTEASRLLAAQVEKGRLAVKELAKSLCRIRTTLSYDEFSNVDVVIEAVVENPEIKKTVLSAVEERISDTAIIATNTSSLSIDSLSEVLRRPSNFLGMHFFNPVHRMPLVEVIRGEKTSKDAIVRTTAYASTLGKTPVVVKNCPGFFVNRVLFPYFSGWLALLRDGANFATVDKVMETFGWPMGPAYLQDVVGIDTSHHVASVLAEGYPDRMHTQYRTAIDVMYELGRYGQKSGVGFYRYTKDKKGRLAKEPASDSADRLAEVQPTGRKEFSDGEVVDRLMLPMIIETVRCLEEGIVETPAEADMALVLGIGFPPFLGGALKYADSLGLKSLVSKASGYASIGALYEPTDGLKRMAADNKRFYPK